MAERSLQTVPQQSGTVDVIREDVELIKRTFAKGMSDDELAIFMASSQRLGLSIISREIHGIIYNANKPESRTLSLQIGIDGYRKVAARSGEYLGQDGPYWCGSDGEWKDIWLDNKPPMAAKVGVWRKGFTTPLYAVGLFREYNTGKGLWSSKPALMIAKCVEGLAIRKAFADWLSGTYSVEEMEQAGGIEVEGRTVNRATGEIQLDPPQRAQSQPQQLPPSRNAKGPSPEEQRQTMLNREYIWAKSNELTNQEYDALVLEYAGGNHASVADIPISELSQAFNRIHSTPKSDVPAMVQFARDLARSGPIEGEVIDIDQPELVEAGNPDQYTN